MANEKNIVPYRFTSEQSREEAARNGQKGGIASGVARRKKRALKDAAELFLSLPVTDTRVWNHLALAGVEPEEIDNQMAMIAGLHAAAAAGNPAAGRLIMDMLGENTKEDPVEDQMAKARDLLEGLDSVIE